MLKSIAIYHIGFGILAIITTTFPELIGGFFGDEIINYLIGSLLIFFGILVFRKNKIGIWRLIFFNFLQLFNFRTGGLIYRFQFGLNFLVDIQNFLASAGPLARVYF